MPRIWSRATRTRPCGSCGALITTGEALLEVQLPQPLRHPKVRCRACAALDHEFPPVTIVVPEPPPRERVRLQLVPDQPTRRDWRQHAADPSDVA